MTGNAVPTPISEQRDARQAHFGWCKATAMALAVFLVLLISLGLLTSFQVRRGAPRFRKITQPFEVPAYTQLSYPFLNSRPFAGDKVWIMIWSRGDHHCYLYDLEARVVEGELFGADPSFMSSDGTTLLCTVRSVSSRSRGGFLRELSRAIGDAVRGRRGNGSAGDVETFWALDLRNGTAKKLGKTLQFAGAGSSFFPSPSFRYAFNKATAAVSSQELLIADMQTKSLEIHMVDGQPREWWDDSRIVITTPKLDSVLYDVHSRNTTPLLSYDAVLEALEKAGLDASSGAVGLFAIRNGPENDFYLTDGNRRWLATNSFLFKLERPAGALTLVASDFKFGWSDHFTADGQGYVFSGRERDTDGSAVFFRDLRKGVTRTLVSPIPKQAFSLPSFYSGGVVYVRSNQLWQITLDGSTSTRLFPPP